jgi:hypothetical protein
MVFDAAAHVFFQQQCHTGFAAEARGDAFRMVGQRGSAGLGPGGLGWYPGQIRTEMIVG